MARTGIFGRSGTGKSYFFGSVLEDTVPDFDYAVHFDIEDEEIGMSLKGEPLFKSFYIDQGYANQVVDYQGRQIPLIQAIVLEERKVRVIPDGLKEDEIRELFRHVSKLSMEIGKQGKTAHISADEAHMYVPDDEELPDAVERMITGGRKKGVEWTFCTQRPAKLHATAFTQLNFGIYFHLPKDNDRMKVNNSSGFNAYHKLESMEEREAWVENLDTGDLAHLDTNTIDRHYDHFSGDDGIADEVLSDLGEGVDRSEEDV